MTGHHARSESATATMRCPPSPRASSPSASSARLNGPAAGVRHLRSALRGLSISDPSPPGASPQAPLSPMSPMSSAIRPGPSRNERSALQSPSPSNSTPGTVARTSETGPASVCASGEAPAAARAAEGWLRQLKSCTQRLRVACVPGSDPGSDPGSVDSAYEEFAMVRYGAADAVWALLCAHKSPETASRHRQTRNGSVAETMERPGSTRMAHGSASADGSMDNLRASFSCFDLGDSPWAPTGPGNEDKSRHSRDAVPSSWPAQNEPYLAAIREWRAALAKLLQSHRKSLAATIQALERDAPREMAQRAVDDPDCRAQVIQKMRTPKWASPSSEFPTVSAACWPSDERRFQRYDAVKEAMMQVDHQLAMAVGGAGGAGDKERAVVDHVVAPRGDAVLEFANTGGGADTAVLRFRVSSHMLAETSPIFEAVFGGQLSHPGMVDRDLGELDGQVPREPPRSITCADGSVVRLYSMPQLERNREGALAVLLHAAHMHNDKVPREVSLSQFTAIAEVCLRYRCTSPLELSVEHRWLPAWVHEASEPRPDGLLLISYVFGLRRLFTRVSKTAVLNVVDEEELRAKPWPQAVKDRIWAVRNAKVAQVHAACAAAVHEYLGPPGQAGRQGAAGGGDPLCPLTSTPRCPRGDHWCDATGLGWLLLVLNELQLAWTVVGPRALPVAQRQQRQQRQQPRSLAQLLDVLRSAPSPPHPPHPGSVVCDPAPALRAAVNDVYNSTSGLTLFDVDGKRHGWGLSKHRANERQAIHNVPLGKPGLDGGARGPAPVEDTRGWAPEHGADAVATARGGRREPLQGGGHAETLDDLYALAQVDGHPPLPVSASAPPLTRHHSMEEDSLAEADQLESSCYTDLGGNSSDEGDGGDIRDHREMTEEEAGRILWPDDSTEAGSLAGGRPGGPPARAGTVAGGDGGEKFLAGDLSLRSEDKSLAVLGDKTLGEDLDRRKGITST